MRLLSAVPGIMLAGCLGAGAAPTLIRDWGLHREWRIEQDQAHPERPARLVEIPWSTSGVASQYSQQESTPRRALPQPPAVRAGTRVTVIRRGTMVDIRLRGTALGSARTGEPVAVRAGLGNSIVQGIVIGPGVVELTPEKRK